MRVKKIRAFCSEQHHAWLRTMSESAVREIRLLRSMCGNGVMADPLRHRQTKGAATDMVDLTPPRHISRQGFGFNYSWGSFDCLFRYPGLSPFR
jgi:hypothetical protein